MAEKSPQAFRTIREVAEWLDIEAHVLRFWESKFTQIKPVKRAGGRRYYRPADMKLIGGIKVLLHDQGLTIRGAQKKLADDGVTAIADLSPPLDDSPRLDDELEDEAAESANICAEEDPASDDVAASQAGFFDIEALAKGTAAAEAEAEAQADAPDQPGTDAPEPAKAEATDADPAEAAPEPDPPETEDAVAEPEPTAETGQSPPAAPAEEPPAAAPTQEDTPEAPEAPAPEDTPETEPDSGPGAQAPPPPTPLSELRALLHEAVPLSDAQRLQLAPMIERLEALETRLRSHHPGE